MQNIHEIILKDLHFYNLTLTSVSMYQKKTIKKLSIEYKQIQ
jgi:hypothetical protein